MTVFRGWLILRVVSFVLAVAMFCCSAAGKTIYVDDDATGANKGSSWTDAYTYLQEALADAASAQKPVEIRVAQGTYKPNQGLVAIPEFDWRTTTFQLINGAELKGGYAGLAAPDPNARDIELYETILSGDLNGDDAEVADLQNLLEEPTRAENSYHVVTCSGVDESTILDGFKITGGNANGLLLGESPDFDSRLWYGGGMYIISADPSIINCVFEENSAHARGGGIYNSESRSNLTNCFFNRNYALSGGGMYNLVSNAHLNNCFFIENQNHGMFNNDSNPIFTDCIFDRNSAPNGGGMSNHGSNPILTNCIFDGNTSLHFGGGIHNRGSNPLLKNCTFNANSSTYGGGMYNDDSSSILKNCIFSYNTSSESAGGMYVSSYDTVSSHILTNCTFVGNYADYGTAVRCGSYLNEHPSILVLNNSILWDGSKEILNSDNSTITITYSNVQGGWPGEGNIDADPLFADADNGDYHLKSQAGRLDAASGSWIIDDVTSPCIDAGDPNSPVAAEPYPNGGIIDMGAYGGTARASKSPSGNHSRYGGGTGEPNAPYLIYTAEQMNTIGLHEENWDKHFRLMADIDLSAYTGTSFNMIGRYDIDMLVDLPFSGTFDGNGHTISNFTYTAKDVDDIAMFTYVRGLGAAIIDLGLIDPNVNVSGWNIPPGDFNDPDIDPSQYIGTGNNVASLVRWMRSGTVTGCYIRGGRISGRDRVGGLVATNEGIIIDCDSDTEVYGGVDVGGLVAKNARTGEIIGCRSFGRISGSQSVGGLVGDNYTKATIQDSYSAGKVVGNKIVGGLVGVSEGLISNCGSNSDVIGQTAVVGGLAGQSYGQVRDCYASGSVTGYVVVGGLVGYSRGSIVRSYSTSVVTGSEVDSNMVGGLVGDNNAVITSCYSAGSVIAEVMVGGLVGVNLSTITNSYSTAGVNGFSRVGGLAGQNMYGGSIMYCYAAGIVIGDNWTGGLVGWDLANNVVASFWDIETTGQATSQGGIGKTTTEMRSAATFIDARWDFVGETANGTDDFWWIDEGRDYPRLSWEIAEGN